MTVKKQVTKALDDLNETELAEVAEYVAFLRYRSRFQPHSLPDSTQLAELYGAFADEDRQLAEEGVTEYGLSLVVEDVR